MKRSISKKYLALALAGLLALGLNGCGGGEKAGQVPEAPAVSDVDLSAATAITLTGESAAVSGPGAEVDGGVITINAGGTYTVSGSLTNGRILVNAKGGEVTLVLDGADITCPYASPLYIYKADLATVVLAEGTTNTLTDGQEYTFDDAFSSEADQEPNACLYSKSDLVIQGTGALQVNGNYKNGLTGKDTLVLREGHITVNAVGHGVNGKDANTMEGVELTVTAGGDAVRATNDTDPTLGWIRVADSQLTLTAGDDAMHAEGDLRVESGRIDVLSSHEGLEGATVNIADGWVRVVADDDGINAGGSGQHAIAISGGTVTVLSGGDGLDSNGSMTISGGAVTVFSTGRADGALDTDGTMDITGGVVFAATGGSMPGAPRDPGQNTLSLGLDKTLAQGSVVTFQVGEDEYSFTLEAAASSILFSAPELVAGESCTVTCDGETLAQVTVAQGLTTAGQAVGGMGGFGGGRGQRPEGDLPEGVEGRGQRPEGDLPEGMKDRGQRSEGGTPPEGMKDRGQRPEGGTPPEGMKDRGQRPGGAPTEGGEAGEPPEGGSAAADPLQTEAFLIE